MMIHSITPDVFCRGTDDTGSGCSDNEESPFLAATILPPRLAGSMPTKAESTPWLAQTLHRNPVKSLLLRIDGRFYKDSR
jgi:hypothetical protein